MDWVLAVWWMGNLKFTEIHPTSEACHQAGRAYIARKVGDHYVCGPKQIYRPKREKLE